MCAAIRMRLPDRKIDPSTTASTLSSRPICGSGLFFSPLYCITEVREITLREPIRRKFCNQSIRHAVGELLLIRIGRDVREWEYGQRADLCIAAGDNTLLRRPPPSTAKEAPQPRELAARNK